LHAFANIKSVPILRDNDVINIKFFAKINCNNYLKLVKVAKVNCNIERLEITSEKLLSNILSE